MPMMTTRAKVRTPKVAVTASCEVAVNVRNMPSRFIIRTSMNRVKTNGKYLRPSWPMID
ncbi:hypothetical protein D3C87_2188140 [compost metagenome]